MTLRYAFLADTTVRAAYDAAITKVRACWELPLVISGRARRSGPGRLAGAEYSKPAFAHGYCSRHLAADACPYANICEQCDNFTTSPDFFPELEAQFGDVLDLRDDAETRGWHTEVARHARVIASLQHRINRLRRKSNNALHA